ncbi:hypothetical protein MNB_SV-15-1327 [hydrothermal vent metagenome]|uniref:Uncharacterized protein n=1 Tax=hydrothermal vent metagenome TaxID=652676 RepID=A0A1W1EHX5_9ZZZZ
MSEAKERYNRLISIVNSNLSNHNINNITFENYDNLDISIYNYPLSKLLSIDDDKEFLYEVFYKILDRIIDKNTLNHLLLKLKNREIKREKIIKNIFNSQERIIKNTYIDFNK